MMEDDVDEVAPLQRVDFDRVDGDGTRGAGLPIEERQLAKVVSGTKDRQHHFMAIWAVDADFDFALANDIEHLSRIIAVEDHLSRPEATAPRRGCQCAQGLWVESGEERDLSKVGDVALIADNWGSHWRAARARGCSSL